MVIHCLRSVTARAAISPARFTVVMLMLTLSVGCSASQGQSDAPVSGAIASTTEGPSDTAPVFPATNAEVRATTTDDQPVTADTSENEPAPAPSSTSNSTSALPTTQPVALDEFQEPGYVGYPLMGDTGSGEVIRYISSKALDCTGADVAASCSRSVMVNFIQTRPSDPYVIAEGQAVANCDRGVLREVLIDNDLVSYELKSPNAAMAKLLDYTCEEAEKTGLIAAQSAAQPVAQDAAQSAAQSDAQTTTQSASASTMPAGLTEGMTYSEVRSRLISEGWSPKSVEMEHYAPKEQSLYDQGYTEVLGCSGSGLCRFEFGHADGDVMPSGQVLVVITAFAESDVFQEGEPLLQSASLDASVVADDLETN